MQNNIGLIGLKGAGKDTAASFLAERGYKRVAFADALYREVADAFGVTVEFLGDRKIKETPVSELALQNCNDERFIGVCRELDPAGSMTEFLEKPQSPRQILQWWGTEYRRKLDNDSYWLDVVAEIIEKNPHQNFVITDVRFPNEATFVEQLNGKLARIRRPSLEAQAALERAQSGAALHASETALMAWPTHHTFVNVDGEPDKLREAVLSAF